MPEGIMPNKVFRIKRQDGDSIDISESTDDHPEGINYLDHLVVAQPFGVEIEGRPATLYNHTRHFLGAIAVERVVRDTGIGEIYYDTACEDVYSDWQQQELAALDAELGKIQ